MQIGNRIYYNQNGKVLFQTGESNGDVFPHLENEEIKYIDLEYGNIILKDVQEYHIENEIIIIDKYKEIQETTEEKLLKEKQELENQLLLKEDKEIGGIL